MTTKACPGNPPDQQPHVEDVSMFSRDRSRKDGMAPYCRTCAAARQRAWKQAHPDKVRAAKQKYRQKVTPCPAPLIS